MQSQPLRPTWQVTEPPGGFGTPWPLLYELCKALPEDSWTLVGGLMVQLHAFHADLTPERATTDIDIALHVEIDMTWAAAKRSLMPIGFALQKPLYRRGSLHRFTREGSAAEPDIVDVMIADHVAPAVLERRTGGENLVKIPGGTSALRKTVNCHITRSNGDVTVSVPNVLGALTLKGGAYTVDSRDRQRHLEDAVVLLATIEDADEIVEDAEMWTQHDPTRLRTLHKALPHDHAAWQLITERPQRLRAQRSLEILAERA